jgi:hypothetical protein
VQDIDKLRHPTEAGREHGATSRDIVGAIANEPGFEG